MAERRSTVSAGIPWPTRAEALRLVVDEGARPDWHDGAACRHAPMDVTWFPTRAYDAGPAKAVCRTCPVRVECLAWAMKQGRRLEGIWGGLDEAGRLRLRRVRAVRA
jgi:WhiB family transcriptional regulator, redox-sensing transcriptional regulator